MRAAWAGELRNPAMRVRRFRPVGMPLLNKPLKPGKLRAALSLLLSQG